jgi:hypothetical protein
MNSLYAQKVILVSAGCLSVVGKEADFQADFHLIEQPMLDF